MYMEALAFGFFVEISCSKDCLIDFLFSFSFSLFHLMQFFINKHFKMRV